MFNQGVGGAGRSQQASATGSHNNSGNSALMAANAKLKRNKASPKATGNGVTALDSTSLKSPGSSGPPTSLKYAQGGASSQQNFLDKYSTKTRNKIG